MAVTESDVVVFGATGFTGSRVAKALLRLAPTTCRIAVGGRDKGKLMSVLSEVDPDNTAEVVVADVNDASSLLEMAKSTRLVLNCVGPYRFWGEAVVSACIEGKAHYLDVCGEPEFIEEMAYKYNSKAAEAGVVVASAAGFDSVPADMGTLFTLQQFQAPARISSIDSFLTLSTGPAGFQGHYPTWQCAVLGVAAAGELRALRAKVKREGKGPPQPAIPGPRPSKSAGARFSKAMSAWALPFIGADASIVRRTQAALSAQGMQCAHYTAMFTAGSRWSVFLFGIFGSIFMKLAGTPWGRSLLLRYPRLFSYGLFSHEGPTKEMMEQTSFSMTFVARGYTSGSPESNTQKPDMQVITRVEGPEPGYVATPIFLSVAGLTLLDEEDKLASRGGVHTVGTLFQGSSYRERLQQHGIAFSVVSKGETTPF
mmetsp:Transcript_1486/g.2621  ORF Transcript_1486/g.2621 Transcript_1486/m.2621 type:complete len:426 (-) Transcript_1486:380-1657(-)